VGYEKQSEGKPETKRDGKKGQRQNMSKKYKYYFTVPDPKSRHAEVHAVFQQAQVKQHEPH
jgi:hypothetical protein